jgi:hypothetical protein
MRNPAIEDNLAIASDVEEMAEVIALANKLDADADAERETRQIEQAMAGEELADLADPFRNEI